MLPDNCHRILLICRLGALRLHRVTWTSRNAGALALAVSILAATAAIAAAKDFPGMAGANDHPAFSRFAGAVLLNQKTDSYAAMPFALGNIIVDPTSRDFQAENCESPDG